MSLSVARCSSPHTPQTQQQSQNEAAEHTASRGADPLQRRLLD